jgi:hypothetical protein
LTFSGIEVVSSDGSGGRLLVAAVDGEISNVDWTHDGRLVFGRWMGIPDRDGRGPSRIFISDGGTERQLIPDATAPARQIYRDWQVAWFR